MTASSSRNMLRSVGASIATSGAPMAPRSLTASARCLLQQRFASSSAPRQQEDSTSPATTSSSSSIPSTSSLRPPPPANAPLLPETQYHPPTHGHHVCTLHLSAYSEGETLQNLQFFTDFALRTAYALGIPATRPASPPRQTSLWTVPRGPFVHKKSQENFMRRVSSRVIKVYDANEEVVQKWLYFLRVHEMAGVGMKAEVLKRRPVGIGRTIFEGAQEALREGDNKVTTDGEETGAEAATTTRAQPTSEAAVAEDVKNMAEGIVREGKEDQSPASTSEESQATGEAKS
ncbi:ribosomal protein S10 [Microstroma glucosiphilum]|uniref:Small ribosomal subunit protein uS10m n=1 Tax=Pseudomicrostroma glucosiphilum TaxID=1684307 RepID=A0A316U7S9_9BASI|nr:ribosomal protein S10 [Pseudomicrostroma glucosiphilum]PWN20888.1 ribosomal protein S10 [Pseudomicrostroma glucosiphilum]